MTNPASTTGKSGQGRVPVPERSSLLRNISWLTVGSITVKPIWFVFITALCMRVLGTSSYGILTSALALSMILALTSDFGTTVYTVREVANAPEKASLFFSNLLCARLVLGALISLSVPLISHALGYGERASSALLAAAFYAVLLKVLDACRAQYRAIEVMRYEAISVMIERGLVVLGGSWFLLSTRTPAGVLTGMAIGMAIALVLNVAWVHNRVVAFDIRLVRLSFLKEVFQAAFPIGTFVAFTMIYGRIGPVLLEQWDGAVAAGLYGAASRILELLIAIPMIVSTAVLPRFASLQAGNHKRALHRVLRTSVLVMGAISLVVAIALTIAGPSLIHLLSPDPDFASAGSLLQLLIWAFPLITVTMLLSQSLIANDELKLLAVMKFTAMALFIVLNIVLIPRFSIFGTAWSMLVAESILLMGLGFRHVQLNRRQASN